MEQFENLFMGIIIGAILFYWVHKKFSGYLFVRRMRKAKKAEKKAQSFLENEGYEVIDYQQPAKMITYVDGQPNEHRIQADYIAKKDRKKYVVEVKTGESAPRISQAKTRRQLLEYYFCYDSDGILLVNMDDKTIKEISFDLERSKRILSPIKMGYLISLLLGGILGYIIVSKELL